MRIAVFIKGTTFHKGYGGLETQNKTLCEELVKRGCDVTVFSPKKELDYNEKIENGVKYIFIDATYKKYLLTSVNKNNWSKKSLIEFTKIHKQNKFDLVLSQSASAESIILAKHELGIKVVSIAHGTAVSEYKTFFKNVDSFKDIYWLIRNTQYFIRQFFGRQRRYSLGSDRVVAVSKFVKHALISETYISENKITVIYNGADPKAFETKVLPDKKVNLVFLGRVDKSKGIFSLLKMVKSLKGDFLLHVVGEGPDLDEAKKQEYEKVVFYGRLAYLDFIQKVHPDILVFPTQRIEGFPMVIVESMFLGLPVVAYNLGGVQDAIEDQKTGFLIKENSQKEFIQKLQELIDNKEERLKMGALAKEKALKEFTLDKMVESYMNLFEEVLK